jgi:hypothetical protein
MAFSIGGWRKSAVYLFRQTEQTKKQTKKMTHQGESLGG